MRFAAAGLTHVLIQDLGNALLTLLFMTSAETSTTSPAQPPAGSASAPGHTGA